MDLPVPETFQAVSVDSANTVAKNQENLEASICKPSKPTEGHFQERNYQNMKF